MNPDETLKKGAKTKLFGVVLIFLGALNSMLSWRGGLVLSDFYIWLFISGSFLYAIGVIRASDTSTKLQR